MKGLKRNGQLILMFLALGGLTHCGGSIIDKKEVVDTINPIITITSPTPDSALNQTTVEVRGSVSDPEPSSGIDYVVVNGIVASGTTDWEVDIRGLAQGSNTLEATAQDEAGNFSSTSVNVFVDLVPPVVVITSPTAGSVISTNVVVVSGTVSDPEPSSGIDYIVVNGQTASGTDPWIVTISGLTPGSNTLEATAQDKAGNTDTDKVKVIIF